MLTYEECRDMCELSQNEIDAIAEHEHIDSMMAMALGNYLVTHQGEQHIKKIILDDIAHARAKNDFKHVAVLNAVLVAFVKEHPKAQVSA